MVINIAASHRFHLLDLARELQNLGHDVRFYSYVPTRRVISFGLRRESSQSLYPYMLPFLALMRLTRGSDFALRLLNLALDYMVAWFMRPCDVYIGLGTVYKKSFESAKQKFGAITILEWGSKHIDEQLRILSEIPGMKPQNKYFTERSKQGYALADYISVASDHVRVSFEERGINHKKIIQNPYGVDLSMFGPTVLSDHDIYDVIMVGGWSYRKGCDLLTEACRKFGYSLLHVGPLVDLEFPKDPNMRHVEPVNQKKLKEYYSKAKIFALPSREEGLAMVQPQAVACGLPVVCSAHTGGRDLKEFVTIQENIIEMSEYSVDELGRCISLALNISKKQKSPRHYGDPNTLSWKKYGDRYSKNIFKIIATNKK